LQHARRILDRLDWWRLSEWADSDMWSFDDGDAALLLTPLDLAETDALDVTRAATAWLRWCAVADGASPAARLAAVFHAAEARLASHGVREVWCIVHSSDWIKPYLRDLGYRVAERLLTFEIEPQRAQDASLFLAGLQTIPRELYEAATVDGANPRQQFFNVTLPMLAPTTLYVLITTTIQALQVFDQVFIVSNGMGGPGTSTLTMTLNLYQNGFQSFRQGYASALAWVLFIVIFVFTLFQFRRQRRASGAYDM
jgi:hypothetical protein